MTTKDVAEWMLEQVESRGFLHQQEATQQIARLFGEQFTCINQYGNRVIKRSVRIEFGKLAAGSVVWQPLLLRWRRKDGVNRATEHGSKPVRP